MKNAQKVRLIKTAQVAVKILPAVMVAAAVSTKIQPLSFLDPSPWTEG